MGGGGGLGGVVGDIGKGLGAVVTGGTSLIPGSPTARLGSNIGNILTLGASKGIGGGGNLQAPTVGGQQDPLSMLTMSGGAPLLTNIALGADVQSSIMGYFGAQGGSTEKWNQWVESLNPDEQKAVNGLFTQLSQIKDNTDMRNQAVQKLADDFPNIMAQKIPQYSAMADDATKQLMDQAMQQISAKQAAGGMFSSGATAEAAAQAGAGLAMNKLQYGTDFALQDFNQQYNNAASLQAFQQKMLGQGSTMGFNAVQNALSRNMGANQQQANLNFQADQSNQQQGQAMWGALGGLGGTVIGGMMGGPMGAYTGNQMGQMIGGGGGPRLNLNSSMPNYGPRTSYAV